MLRAMIARFLVAALAFWGASVATAHAQSETHRAEAVVELFTSQGCTQCPRANRLLGMFSREEGVLALTFPVGIWDYLDWQDTFAKPEFTDRQRAFASRMRGRGRFTPQLIINGASQASASYWDEARAMLEMAQENPLPRSPDLNITQLGYNRVRVTIGPAARRAETDVWLISYDPGPVWVYITRGVNMNRRVYHYNLARDVDRVGGWSGSGVWFERRCAPECAVIIQEPNGGPIIAAAYTRRRN